MTHNNLVSFRKKIERYIKLWEDRCYPNGIPDQGPMELESNSLIPSYRQVCIAIMKNDYQLKTLGYSRLKCKAYMAIKRDELIIRGKIKHGEQLSIL